MKKSRKYLSVILALLFAVSSFTIQASAAIPVYEVVEDEFVEELASGWLFPGTTIVACRSCLRSVTLKLQQVDMTIQDAQGHYPAFYSANCAGGHYNDKYGCHICGI